MHRLLSSDVPGIVRQMQIPARVVKGSAILNASRVGTIGVSAAASKYGVRPLLLRRLDPNGSCFVSKAKGNNALRLYDEDKLHRSIEIWKRSMAVGDAARLIGVPGFAVRQLADDQKLRRIQDGDAILLGGGRELVERFDVERLVRKIDESASSSFGCHSTPAHHSLFGRRFEASAWASVIAALAEGHIGAHHLPSRSPGLLASVLVDAAEVAQHLSSIPRSGPSDEVLSCASAAKLIWVAESTLARLVRADLLGGTLDAKAGAISLNEIRAFGAKFVLAQEAHVMFGFSWRRLLPELERLGASPVYNDICLMWDRSELEALLSQRLRNRGEPESLAVKPESAPC